MRTIALARCSTAASIRRSCWQAFDAEVLRPVQPLVITSGPSDDDLEGESSDHPLANPPLQLDGLPSFGSVPDDRGSRSPVMCCAGPMPECLLLMRVSTTSTTPIAARSGSSGRRGSRSGATSAAELTMLGDAALCAETNSSSPDDLDASPGWQWVSETYTLIQQGPRPPDPADKLIDDVAAKLRVETKAALGLPRPRSQRDPRLDRRGAAVRGHQLPGDRDRRPHLSRPHRPDDHPAARRGGASPGGAGRCSTTGC